MPRRTSRIARVRSSGVMKYTTAARSSRRTIIRAPAAVSLKRCATASGAREGGDFRAWGPGRVPADASLVVAATRVVMCAAGPRGMLSRQAVPPIPDDLVERLYRRAEAGRWSLPRDVFARALQASAERGLAGQ